MLAPSAGLMRATSLPLGVPRRARDVPGRRPGSPTPAGRRSRYLLGVLLSADGSVVLLVDLQERLMPAIYDGEVVVSRTVRLAQAARMLDVPVRATEQYPAGL